MSAVIKLLRAVPRWLAIVLAAMSAGVVLLVGQISKNMTGWLLFWLLVSGVFFAGLAIVVPQLQQWQTKQDQQLELDLHVGMEFLHLPNSEHVDALIDREVELARTARFESLAEAESRAKVKPEILHFTSSATDEGDSRSDSWRDLQNLEERRKAGEDLTDEEAERLAEATRDPSIDHHVTALAGCDASLYGTQ
jgi:hypothetical protein